MLTYYLTALTVLFFWILFDLLSRLTLKDIFTGTKLHKHTVHHLPEIHIFSPELVVGVSHLMSSKFRHQDLDDSDKYEEVNLKEQES